MQKNVAGQKIGAQMISAADGSAFTGSVTVSVTGDAGAQATGSVGAGACTHEGNGYHTYAPAQAETNYDLIAWTFTGTGAVPVTVQVYTRPQRVKYVYHDGNNATSGTAAKAAIEGAAAGDTVCIGPGTFTTAAAIAVPDYVVVRGSGQSVTILSSTSGGGVTGVVPGSHSIVEQLTIQELLDGANYGTSDQVIGAVLQDVELLSAGLENVTLSATSPSTMIFRRVTVRTVAEWGFAFAGAAHHVEMYDVQATVTSNGNPVDAKGISIDGGMLLVADDVRITPNEASSGGSAIAIQGASQALITNCAFADFGIAIIDSGSYVLASNCEFNRAGVIGNPSRLKDVFSSLQPSIPYRKLGVDANNRITGIAGTITTLDGLDTAQDAQHATTQASAATAATQATTAANQTAAATLRGSLGLAAANLDTQLADLPTNAEFAARTVATADYATTGGLSTLSASIAAVNNLVDAVPTAAENTMAVWAAGTRTITGGTITTYTGDTPQTGDAFARLGAPTGVTLAADLAAKASQASVDAMDAVADAIAAKLPTAGAKMAGEGAAAKNLDQVSGGGGVSQPRINRRPSPAFTVKVSRRADGTHKATSPIRLTPGAVDNVYVFVDMSPLFGAEDFVETVGTPSVEAGGSLTAAAEGPRDTYALIKLGGTAAASEERTIAVPVTMTSGTTLTVVFDVLVFAE